MAVNQENLGKRLRQARENRGLSQEAVARELGLPRTAVTRIELGERPVSTLELDRLARLYRRPIQEFFQDESPAEEDALVVLCRLAPFIGSDPQAKEELSKCLDLCREGHFLRQVLHSQEMQALASYGCPPPSSPWDAMSQGNRVADEERRRMGLGFSPIGAIDDVLAGQGVWCATAQLADSVSGLFLRHPEVGAVIIVNARHSDRRRRFAFAHEYAHAMADGDRMASVTSEENARELVEKRANAFAAAFLMPDEGVRRFLEALDKDRGSRDVGAVFSVAEDQALEWGSRPKSAHPITLQDVAFMAHHFGVSYQAAVFRLRSLRILTATESEFLNSPERVEDAQAYLGLFGLQKDNGDEMVAPRNRGLRFRIAHLAIEAFRRGIIASGRLREIGRKVGITGGDLLRVAGGSFVE